MAGLFTPIQGNENVSLMVDVSYDLPDNCDLLSTQTTIQFMHLTAINNQPFVVRAPVTGILNVVTLPKSKPLGAFNEWVEMSPLPFGTAVELRALPSFPTFYLALDQWGQWKNSPSQYDMMAKAGDPLANALEAYIGVMFQNRLSLSPQRWIDIFAKAANNSAEWNSLGAHYGQPNQTTIRVLDHAGRSLNAQKISFDWREGQACGAYTVVGIHDGELTLPNTARQLRWKGDPHPEDISLPVISLYETGASAPPGEWLDLPYGTGPWHVQVLELSRWFSKPREELKTKRFHTGCRVEPIVDGIPTFRRLIDDLLASAHPGHGAHLAGWVFKDFQLDPKRPETRFTTLVKSICQQGGDVRMLVNKYLTLKSGNGSPNVNRIVIAPVMTSLGLAPGLAALLKSIKALDVETDFRGFVCLAAGTALAMAALSLVASETISVEDILQKKFEQSKPVVDTIEGYQLGTAVWDPYPPKFADNPLAANLPWVGLKSLADAIDQVGNWHQKFQIIKRKNDAGTEYIAYTGGVDIDENRIDCPGHQIWAPFHDVQARIMGPAVEDFCRTWSERYQRLGAARPEVFTIPGASSLPAQPAKHLVQVGRTYFKPAEKPDSGQPLPFAPNGDSTIVDTLIQAVKSAKEYIYIEDQYFTPNAQEPGPNLGNEDEVQTLFDALLAAAKHCRRLLILVPDETDQTFGDVRRRYLFAELAKQWGSRFQVGTILRRPLLSIARLSSSEGRCVLADKIDQNVTRLHIAPPSRIPASGPFWLWVDGELMRSTRDGVYEVSSNDPYLNVDVERGLFDATPRTHKTGAAVTISQLKGIYVHAKLMIVDDVFVSIGSANLNRRGLYHDGEISVFTIPEQLRAAPDNPARTLRMALWAEHLGLPPSMGSALLTDTITAFELFREKRGARGRFTQLASFPANLSIALPSTGSFLNMLFKIAVAAWETPQESELWNAVIDPTGYGDPHYSPGPLPH